MKQRSMVIEKVGFGNTILPSLNLMSAIHRYFTPAALSAERGVSGGDTNESGCVHE